MQSVHIYPITNRSYDISSEPYSILAYLITASRALSGFRRLIGFFEGLKLILQKVLLGLEFELPSVNKGLPLGLLAVAVYAGLRDGALFAGESAFALAYLAFDLYWKLQQENLIKKIETGLSKSDQAKIGAQ